MCLCVCVHVRACVFVRARVCVCVCVQARMRCGVMWWDGKRCTTATCVQIWGREWGKAVAVAMKMAAEVDVGGHHRDSSPLPRH